MCFLVWLSGRRNINDQLSQVDKTTDNSGWTTKQLFKPRFSYFPLFTDRLTFDISSYTSFPTS